MDNAIELTPERINRIVCDPGLLCVYQTIVKDVESRNITESEKEEMVLELLEQVIRDPAMFRAYEAIEKAEHDRVSEQNAINRKLAEADRRVAEAKRGADREVAEAGQRAKREIAHNLKANGFPVEEIVELTGLSEAEIQEL
jgi:predicted transposase/invertase (TIGR01784 family)